MSGIFENWVSVKGTVVYWECKDGKHTSNSSSSRPSRLNKRWRYTYEIFGHSESVFVVVSVLILLFPPSISLSSMAAYADHQNAESDNR